MLSALAHEINQPLAAAANYARACVRFAKSDEGVTKQQLIQWMEKAAAQSERASEIVKRLRAFMKKDRTNRSTVNLNRLVDDVIRLPTLISPSSGFGTAPTIGLELDELLPSVFADKVQIEQVLVNLIRNAVEAMEGKSGDQHRLTIRTESKDGTVVVRVTDTGYGITAEHQAQLFNPFFTTKSEGMGLGLSISRSIIESHGGQMIVETRSGHGTTISFLLPIHLQDDPA
jgi:C4-dicarboxylate-specific signal transduction histidine kinase